MGTTDDDLPPAAPPSPEPDPGGPVEVWTAADLKAMHEKGMVLNATDGNSVPAEMRYLLAPAVRAKWEAEFHKDANMQVLIAWYERGADGQIDWRSGDAEQQAMKVADPHFQSHADALAFVQAVGRSVAGVREPLV